jgi:hypothetical protein
MVACKARVKHASTLPIIQPHTFLASATNADKRGGLALPKGLVE